MLTGIFRESELANENGSIFRLAASLLAQRRALLMGLERVEACVECDKQLGGQR